MPVETTESCGSDILDLAPIMARNWKNVGIECDLKLKEGALSSRPARPQIREGRHHAARRAHLARSLSGRGFLPRMPLNLTGVNDAKLTEMITLQRCTFDVAKQRDIAYEIQFMTSSATSPSRLMTSTRACRPRSSETGSHT